MPCEYSRVGLYTDDRFLPTSILLYHNSNHWVENSVIFSDHGSGERHVFRYYSFTLSIFCTNHERVGPRLRVETHERHPRYKGSLYVPHLFALHNRTISLTLMFSACSGFS